MRFIYYLLFVVIFLSCKSNSTGKGKEANLLFHRDSFPLKNLTTFVIDSSLQKTYKNLSQLKHPQIDSTLNPVDYPRDLGTKVYLYSWQERDSLMTEFTVLVDGGEFGLRLVYFLLDKNNKIISTVDVAGLGGEGGIVYETRSYFKTKDTLSEIHAASTDEDWRGVAPFPKLSRRKGDSTFYNNIFLKNGKILRTKTGEKKELNL